MAAEALALACAFCGGGSQPFDLDDDGNLVCAPGRGCSRKPGRRPAVVRDLLCDAPSSCMRLDIAVREACEKRYATTDAHRATALRIVAMVQP